MKRIFIVLLVLSLAIPIASAADPYDGFTPTSINGSAPLIISFWDISYDYPTSWMWNYTDVTGADVPITMGISQNLTYTFNVAGNNSIQLITTSAFGTNVSPANTVFVNVTGPAGIPAADFSVDDNNVPAGTVVHFTDLSTNVPTSWLWQFQSYGNPIEWTTMSTDQNPSFTTDYINNLGIDPGVYNIRLTATNAAGSDTETKYGFLTATEAPESPIASFTPTGTLEDTIYVIRINTNSTIYFSDTSTAGTPISWNWSFGSLLGTLYSSE
jgi:PKD repeat protein